MKNILNPEIITTGSLGAQLQDIWHYCAFLVELPGVYSTFEGDREFAGIRGRVNCYDRLYELTSALQYPCFPAFANIALRHSDACSTIAQLKREARKIFKACLAVAKDNGIDPYSGDKLNKDGFPFCSI